MRLPGNRDIVFVIHVRIASRPSNRPKRCSMYTASSVNRSAKGLQSPDAVISRTFALYSSNACSISGRVQLMSWSVRVSSSPAPVRSARSPRSSRRDRPRRPSGSLRTAAGVPDAMTIAGVHRDDAVGQAHDHRDVVLDHEQRHPVLVLEVDEQLARAPPSRAARSRTTARQAAAASDAERRCTRAR